jgi:hypothetical protein
MRLPHRTDQKPERAETAALHIPIGPAVFGDLRFCGVTGDDPFLACYDTASVSVDGFR